MSNHLITGVAGFIGYHLAERLLDQGKKVLGIDNINSYYDVSLKEARLSRLQRRENFSFQKLDIADQKAMQIYFDRNNVDVLVNLGAQPGVRYSLTNPYAYINSNIVGFMNILEGCRHNKIKHLIFASSSSVYGANTKMPFSIHDNVDHPVSLYAATKKSNELMAHTYSSLYGLPTTGLRFFTVYGPWGRPDMAPFIFTKAIIEGKPIQVFNNGKMKRDFTYVDDIIEGVMRIIDRTPTANLLWNSNRPDPGSSYAPYRIYNIGNNNPVELTHFIEVLEETIGKKAVKNLMPIQLGDISSTYADIDDLVKDISFKPKISIKDGIEKFVCWYKEYYRCS